MVARYDVSETIRETNKDHANAVERITITCAAPGLFSVAINAANAVAVSADSSGMLLPAPSTAPHTFWLQDLNAVAVILPANGIALKDGANWNVSPSTDSTGLSRPDSARQNSDVSMLVPLHVQLYVSKAQVLLRADGRLVAGDGSAQRTAIVQTETVFNSSGTLLHAGGMVMLGRKFDQMLGATAFFYTRIWSIDPAS